MPSAAYIQRPIRQRPFPPLGRFVALSLLVHGGLLWHWQQPPLTIAAPRSAGMTVHLLERQQPEELLKAQPPAAQTVTPASEEKPQALAKPPTAPARSVSAQPQQQRAMPERHAAPASGAIATAGVQQKEPAVIDEAALAASLKVTLQRAFERHFSYPPLARRRGWQGEVLLTFRLEADGRISDARVLHSSGYRLLDRAALTALGKVGRIASGIPRGLAMQLPVIYRLEG